MESEKIAQVRLPSTCFGWLLRYEIHDVQSKYAVFTTDIELSPDDIYEVLGIPVAANEQNHSWLWRFEFPISVGRDLQTLVALRTLVRLDLPLQEKEKEKDELRLDFKVSTQHLKNAMSSTGSSVRYRSQLSRTEDSIAFVEQKSKSRFSSQVLEIWDLEERPEGSSPSSPKCAFKGRLCVGGNDMDNADGFLFHPYLPLAILSEWDCATLWWFKETGKYTCIHTIRLI